MSRNYGTLNRRSGSAAWQWILIGVIIGFGCSAIVLLAGLASGAFTVGGQPVANLPTQTPFIITATSAPVTATATATQGATAEVALDIQAPTATPTLNPTLLTLQPNSGSDAGRQPDSDDRRGDFGRQRRHVWRWPV